MRRSLLRWGRLGGGGALILFGVISGFLPVLQGWVFILLGLGMMAPESKRARAALEWAKAKVARDTPASGDREDGEHGREGRRDE